MEVGVHYWNGCGTGLYGGRFGIDRHHVDDTARQEDSRTDQRGTSQARDPVWRIHYEAARLTADAFDHSLERPETIANVYAIMGRIRLFGSPAVVKAAEERCHFIVDLYSKPNLTVDQIYDWLRSAKHPLKDFAITSRVELDHFAS